MELKFDNIEEVKAFVAELKSETPVTVARWSPAEFAKEIACLARSDRKIAAIRLLRAITDLPLKESKDAIEDYWGWTV